MSKESNTVVLARVSSKAQEDEGYSLDSQMKLLNSYCLQRNLNVVKVFKIAETASKDQSRKVFHELLTYLKTGNIYHLTVEKTDRLTRNFKDAVAIDEWLEKDDRRKLHAVKESLILHKAAKSDVKFMWNIHLSVAKKYTDNLREEAMKGWAEKLAQGWLPCPPPPGYMTAIKNGKKIHVPDPDTRHLMKRAFELYLLPHASIESIAGEMDLMGIRTRYGRPYFKSKVQKILSNPFYIGINHFNGKDYPGAQESIISKELFYKVQEKMHSKRPARYSHHNPVFRNVIKCKNCGGLVTWQLQKGKYYGNCQRTSDKCKGSKFLREDLLEEDIKNMLRDLVCPSKEVLGWVAEAMRARKGEVVKLSQSQAQALEQQIERLKRMDDNLYDDKLAGEVSQERYQQKHDLLTQELAKLGRQLESIDKNAINKIDQKLALFDLSQRASDIYLKKTNDQKRSIIAKLFEDMQYDNGQVLVNYTKFTGAIAHNVRLTHKIIGGTK